MEIELKAIAQVLRWLRSSAQRRVIIVVTNSMTTFARIRKGLLYSDLIDPFIDSQRVCCSSGLGMPL